VPDSDDPPPLVEPVLEQGAEAKICIMVQNLGNRPADPFVVEWNPDAFGLISPGPGTVSKQVDSLDVGQSRLVLFNFTYTEAGNFHTIAKADAFDDVMETDEADNLAILDVVVEPAGPDQVITNLAVEPEPARSVSAETEQVAGVEPVLVQGEEAIVSIIVYNQGNRSAGPFIVEWNPDARGLITPCPGTVSTQIDSLGAGQSAAVELHFTYHQHGGFRTVAKVDAFDDVEEMNEANNLAVLNVVVEPAPIDLRITNFTISPWPPIRGSKATASIVVRNCGNYPTGSFWVQWKPTGEDAGTGPRIKVDGLHPNQSTTVQLESTFCIAGPYTSWAMVDIYDQVIETNENNNVSCLPVNVEPRQTTVQVTFDSLKVHEAFADTRPGQEGPCSSGRCYDPNYTVQIVSEPPPFYATEEPLPAEEVVLPANMPIPPGVQLPDGMRRELYRLYLPLVSR
jgi:subtilase family serine protease